MTFIILAIWWSPIFSHSSEYSVSSQIKSCLWGPFLKGNMALTLLENSLNIGFLLKDNSLNMELVCWHHITTWGLTSVFLCIPSAKMEKTKKGTSLVGLPPPTGRGLISCRVFNTPLKLLPPNTQSQIDVRNILS